MKREAIMQAIQRVPSGENCQPWHYRWEGQQLFVYHDEERARHVLNTGDFSSLLSLGCVVESARLAAAQQQQEVVCEFPQAGPGQPWAVIGFRSSVTDLAFDRRLHQQIPLRYTFRGPFVRSGAITAITGQVAPLSAGLSGAGLFVVHRKDPQLIDHLVEADTLLWRKKEAIADLFRWTRFHTGEYVSKKDGMYWSDLGISRPERVALLQLSRKPSLIKLFNRLGFRWVLHQKIRRNMRSSAGFICITCTEWDRHSVITAGRLAFRSWLYLCGEGFSLQPHTLCTPLFAAKRGPLLSETEYNRTQSGAALLREHFGMENHHLPTWLFRFGIAPVRQTRPTLRRELSQLFHEPGHDIV